MLGLRMGLCQIIALQIVTTLTVSAGRVALAGDRMPSTMQLNGARNITTHSHLVNRNFTFDF